MFTRYSFNFIRTGFSNDLPTHTSFNADPVTPLDMDSVSIWLFTWLLGTLRLPPMTTPTPADRMALALCVAVLPGSTPCQSPCNACRVNSAAVAHEIARQLRERYGSSVRADWLDGVGCHPGTVQGTVQTVQEVFHV